MFEPVVAKLLISVFIEDVGIAFVILPTPPTKT